MRYNRKLAMILQGAHHPMPKHSTINRYMSVFQGQAKVVMLLLVTVFAVSVLSPDSIALGQENSEEVDSSPIEEATPEPSGGILGGVFNALTQPTGPTLGPKATAHIDRVSQRNLGLGCTDFTNVSVKGCFAQGTLLLMGVFGWLLGGAGVVLDYAIEELVLKMGAHLNELTTVREGWATFRDLGNIIIIFSLLAIGIATILKISSYGIRQLLPTLIVVALLINFSYFFTSVVIDTGNLLAAQFYKQIQTCDPEQLRAGTKCVDVSDRFMNALSLTTVYNLDQKTGQATIIIPDLNKLDYGNIIIISLMGSLLFLVTAFVFLAAAFLLIGRFAILVFVLMLAPLAFAAYILPVTRSSTKKWWGYLFNYTFFAPVYILLTVVVLDIVESNAFQHSIGKETSGNFSVAATNPIDVSSFLIFLNYFVVMALMIGSLLIAKQLGVAGSQGVIKIGNNIRGKVQGAIGRNTVGRAAAGFGSIYGLTQTTRTGRNARRLLSAASLGLLSDQNIRGAFDAGRKAKFGSTKGLADVRKDERETIDQTLKRFDGNPRRQGNYIQGLPGRDRAYAFGKLSARDRAAVEEFMDPKTVSRLREAQSVEEQEKTDKAARDARKDRENRDIRINIDAFVRGNPITMNNPATGNPHTIEELVQRLPGSQARRLPKAARLNEAVIKNLSTRHLKDLLSDGDLEPDEITYIRNIIRGPLRYANQAAHRDYIDAPANRALWS
jgi:hypothetical protein